MNSADTQGTNSVDTQDKNSVGMKGKKLGAEQVSTALDCIADMPAKDLFYRQKSLAGMQDKSETGNQEET